MTVVNILVHELRTVLWDEFLALCSHIVCVSVPYSYSRHITINDVLTFTRPTFTKNSQRIL